MDVVDIWSDVAALNALATPAMLDAIEETWTAETTPRALYGVVPSLIAHLGQLIQHLPVPSYVVMADQATVNHTGNRITLEWKGFAIAPPVGMGSRQPVDAITTLGWPTPYCWELSWQFQDGHLHTVAICSTDPAFHSQTVMSWHVAHAPLTLHAAWSAESLDDLCLASENGVYWLSHSFLSLFRQMLDTRHYWLNTADRRRLRRHVMNRYTHGWLERWRLGFPVALGSTLVGLGVATDLPHHFPRVTDAGIAGVPLLIWALSYLVMRARADRRVRA